MGGGCDGAVEKFGTTKKTVRVATLHTCARFARSSVPRRCGTRAGVAEDVWIHYGSRAMAWRRKSISGHGDTLNGRAGGEAAAHTRRAVLPRDGCEVVRRALARRG